MTKKELLEKIASAPEDAEVMLAIDDVQRYETDEVTLNGEVRVKTDNQERSTIELGAIMYEADSEY